MRPNHTKQIMAEGRVAFGAWCTMIDPAVVEMVGHAGYDFCFIDMEHVSANTLLVEHMCRAADASGVTPIVRVPDDNPKTILRVLEAGAQGIVVPHVMSGADARRLAQAVRYPPTGARGMAPTSRANRYGLSDFDTHMRESNEEILLIALIEDKEAVEEIEDILTTPGLDLVYMAALDLSGSLGFPDSHNPPATREAIEKMLDVSRRVGGARFAFPANHRMYTKTVAELVEMGASMITTVLDYSVLAQGFRRDIESLAPYRGKVTR